MLRLVFELLLKTLVQFAPHTFCHLSCSACSSGDSREKIQTTDLILSHGDGLDCDYCYHQSATQTHRRSMGSLKFPAASAPVSLFAITIFPTFPSTLHFLSHASLHPVEREKKNIYIYTQVSTFTVHLLISACHTRP